MGKATAKEEMNADLSGNKTSEVNNRGDVGYFNGSSKRKPYKEV